MNTFKEYLFEIDRLSDEEFKGGTEHIDQWIDPKYVPEFIEKSKPLPGNNGFTYSIIDDKRIVYGGMKCELLVAIFDPKKQKCVGCLSLENISGSGLKPKKLLPNHYQEDTISVDEEYRGKKIATSLYGIVLSIMKATLVSDDLHTSGGEAMWKHLIAIPGVKLYAIVSFKDLTQNEQLVKNDGLQNALNIVDDTHDEKVLDTFLSKHKNCGRYIYDTSLLVFPVKLNGKEIQSDYINVYDNKEVCLIAKYGPAS